MYELRRTWAEISLDALEHNVERVKRLAHPARLMAVVKADAYGHGAVPVARLLAEHGCDYLAVASVDEGMELRRAGIKTPILILGFTPFSLTPLLIDNSLSQTVFDQETAAGFSHAAAGIGKTLRVHVKVDTGMSRLGLVWRGDRTLPQLLDICSQPHLEYEGLFTHLSASEDAHDPLNQRQLSDFSRIVACLRDKGLSFPICHCANSGAVIQYSKARLDMVRAGLLLYGITPGRDIPFDGLPAMTLFSVVSQVKDIDAGASVSYGHTFTAGSSMRVATVAAGYADGYHRSLSGKSTVLIGGRRAPVLGAVCMDMMVVDVTDIPDVAAGDPVVLFGPWRGVTLPVSELARIAGTIPYELICAVSKRVARVYTRDGIEVGRTSHFTQ